MGDNWTSLQFIFLLIPSPHLHFLKNTIFVVCVFSSIFASHYHWFKVRDNVRAQSHDWPLSESLRISEASYTDCLHCCLQLPPLH